MAGLWLPFLPQQGAAWLIKLRPYEIPGISHLHPASQGIENLIRKAAVCFPFLRCVGLLPRVTFAWRPQFLALQAKPTALALYFPFLRYEELLPRVISAWRPQVLALQTRNSPNATYVPTVLQIELTLESLSRPLSLSALVSVAERHGPADLDLLTESLQVPGMA